MKLFALCLSLVFTSALFSADHYVLAGGTGDGTSWTNARGALPTTFVRGDTYWIGDGDYAGFEFATALSGTTLVTIKKAIDDTRCAAIGKTTAECRGTGAGWSNAYGDGVATFVWLQINRGYFVLDGQIPCSDIKNCQRGFVIGPGASGSLFIIGVSSSSVASNLTFKSFTVDGGSCNLKRGFRFCCNGGEAVLMEDVEVKNIGNDPIHLGSYGGVDMNRIYLHTRVNDCDGSSTHADAIEILKSPPSGGAKNTLRNSIINWAGQQLWFTGGSDNPVSGAWDLFSNVFTSPSCPTSVVSVAAVKLRDDSLASSVGPMNIYNNTFACLYYAFRFTPLSSGDIRNNIFYSFTNGVGGIQSLTHDYNWFDTALGTTLSEANAQTGTNPFVNLSTQDLRLAAGTTAGQTLDAPTTDLLGATRGGDGTWDRGAYEFGAASAPATPTGLAGTAGSTEILWSWNVSVGTLTYTLSCSTSDGGPYDPVVTQAGTSYTQTGLTNGTPQYCVVSATNSAGTSANSSQATATPTSGAPGIPQNFSAVAGNNQIALSWSAVVGAVDYNIYRSLTTATGYSLLASTTGTQYTDLSAVNGTTYYYVVTAENASGESGDSDELAATPTSCVSSLDNSFYPVDDFGARAGIITYAWTAIPRGDNIDGVMMFSDDVPGGFDDTAVAVRLGVPGTAQAKNTDVYAATNTVAYTTGNEYRWVVAIDVGAKTYNAWVNDTQITADYGFRSTQTGVTGLRYFSIYSDDLYGSPATGVDVCGFGLVLRKLNPSGGVRFTGNVRTP